MPFTELSVCSRILADCTDNDETNRLLTFSVFAIIELTTNLSVFTEFPRIEEKVIVLISPVFANKLLIVADDVIICRVVNELIANVLATIELAISESTNNVLNSNESVSNDCTAKLLNLP